MAGQASASTPSTSSSTTICRLSAASVPVRRSPAQTFRQPLPRQVKSRCHGQRLPGRFTKTFTGETVPFSFTLENAEGAYTFDFPEVQISGDWPDAGALTLFRFSWISPRPILRQLSPAFPKCRRRQSGCASHFNWGRGIHSDVNRHAYAS